MPNSIAFQGPFLRMRAVMSPPGQHPKNRGFGVAKRRFLLRQTIFSVC